MPGAKSQLSIDLSNVKRDIRCAVANGNEEEIEQLRSKRDTMQEQQDEVQEARRAARVNSHTTVEINRAISETSKATKEAVQDGTRYSEVFFQSVGGAGSSNDLFIHGDRR